MAAYSSTDDLLHGDLPLGSKVDPGRFVNAATDEIDSEIGVLYETPITVASLARHSQLYLKRCANFIATGRLVLAVAAGGEDAGLHAYGSSMLAEGLAMLMALRSGSVVLDGATAVAGSGATNGPTIKNYDEASAVDAFYDRVMKPENGLLTGVLPQRDWAPGDNPNGFSYG